MRACAISPANRQKQVRLVGNDLIKNYGKKRYYTVKEVKDANKRQDIGLDSVAGHMHFSIAIKILILTINRLVSRAITLP